MDNNLENRGGQIPLIEEGNIYKVEAEGSPTLNGLDLEERYQIVSLDGDPVARLNYITTEIAGEISELLMDNRMELPQSSKLLIDFLELDEEPLIKDPYLDLETFAKILRTAVLNFPDSMEMIITFPRSVYQLSNLMIINALNQMDILDKYDYLEIGRGFQLFKNENRDGAVIGTKIANVDPNPIVRLY